MQQRDSCVSDQSNSMQDCILWRTGMSTACAGHQASSWQWAAEVQNLGVRMRAPTPAALGVAGACASGSCALLLSTRTACTRSRSSAVMLSACGCGLGAGAAFCCLTLPTCTGWQRICRNAGEMSAGLADEGRWQHLGGHCQQRRLGSVSPGASGCAAPCIASGWPAQPAFVMLAVGPPLCFPVTLRELEVRCEACRAVHVAHSLLLSNRGFETRSELMNVKWCRSNGQDAPEHSGGY
jgi:hypothetical protein